MDKNGKIWFNAAMSKKSVRRRKKLQFSKDLLESRLELIRRAEERLADPVGQVAAKVAAVEKRVTDDAADFARYASEVLQLRKKTALHQSKIFSLYFVRNLLHGKARLALLRKKKAV